MRVFFSAKYKQLNCFKFTQKERIARQSLKQKNKSTAKLSTALYQATAKKSRMQSARKAREMPQHTSLQNDLSPVPHQVFIPFDSLSSSSIDLFEIPSKLPFPISILLDPRKGGPNYWANKFTRSESDLQQVIMGIVNNFSFPANATASLIKTINYLCARKPSTTSLRWQN